MRTEIRVAGFGGQGVLLIGKVLGQAAVVEERRKAALTTDYGPEKTGGWSKADLVVSDLPIPYPIVQEPDAIVLLSQDAYRRYARTARRGAIALYEESLVHPEGDWDVAARPVPSIQIATGLGNKRAANIAMIGAIVEATKIVGAPAARAAVLGSVPKGTEELNLKAFEAGRKVLEEVAA